MTLPPLISPLPPVACPSCLAAAFRLGRWTTCTVCDWKAPRLRPAVQLVEIAPNPIAGTKTSGDLALRALAYLDAHPWSTTVEVAAAIGGRTAETARTILLRAGCQRRHRATGKGAVFEYALPEPAEEGAVAC